MTQAAMIRDVKGFWWGAAVVACCAALLFARLGHYPLWDDEACTTLLAKGVWQTGDSLAIHGKNVMAYGDGEMLFGTHDRVHPPLQLYWMAPFIGLLGDTTFAARLPMVLAGLAAIVLMVWWLLRESSSRAERITFIVILLTNVAMFLYMRQARYYSLAILGNVAAAYLYLHLPAVAGWRRVLPLGAVFATFPLISAQMFAVFAAVFVVDYVLFGRKRVWFTWDGWLALLGPTVVSGVFLLLTWNPFVIATSSSYRLDYKIQMILWSFRDLNLGHMVIGSLMLAAPLVAVVCKKWWLLRAFVAAVAVCIIDPLVDTMTPEIVQQAMIRHMSPIIPLAMLIATGVIVAIWQWKPRAGVAVLLIASLTNVLHWGALQPVTRLRSIPYMWAKELVHPAADPYTLAIEWIKKNTEPGDTIGVDPGYMRYPLMFHVPDRVYSWQIAEKERARLGNVVENRQYVGAEPPLYVFNFARREDMQLMTMSEVAKRQGKRYQQIDAINIYWRDMFRPEITMRTFETADLVNKNWQAVYIYKLVDAKPAGSQPATAPQDGR